MDQKPFYVPKLWDGCLILITTISIHRMEHLPRPTLMILYPHFQQYTAQNTDPTKLEYVTDRNFQALLADLYWKHSIYYKLDG